MSTTSEASLGTFIAPQVQAALAGATRLGMSIRIADSSDQHAVFIEATKQVNGESVNLRTRYIISHGAIRNENDWVYAVAEGIRQAAIRLTHDMMK